MAEPVPQAEVVREQPSPLYGVCGSRMGGRGWLRKEEKLDPQANDRPSRPPAPWEASKLGTHRKGQKQELTQAFYLLQNVAAVWSEVPCFPRTPQGPPSSRALGSWVRADGIARSSRPHRSGRPGCLPLAGAWDRHLP